MRDRLVEAFMAAAFLGNVAALADLLTEDAVLYADGGGKRPAAPNPIRGRDSIMTFFGSLAQDPHARVAPEQTERVVINSLPGFIVHVDDAAQTIAFDIAGDRIAAIYVVRNPDKLRHLS